MRNTIRRRRIPKLYLELGIIVVGAAMTGFAIWYFDSLHLLINWLWFIAGAVFGILVLCLVVAFFAFGARDQDPTAEDVAKRDLAIEPKPKLRIVENGGPKPE
jgi:purine-cytosine permease-like protein